jgi:glycosyltransferase involved in cell wall biosynthesis
MIKVSIITACRNSQSTIEDTINSVVSQHYKNIEYIIVDGGSSDNTLQILQSYGSKISRYITESDKGVYDAMNKGIALATGDIIGFLNSDDFYADNFVINRVVESFSKNNVDAVYADLDYVSMHNKHHIVREWRSGEYNVRNFYYGWMPPHPTFFAKREIYQKTGGYNLTLKTSADYELMLRVCLLFKISVAYIPSVLVKMRMGGQSNRSIMNRIKANLEDRKAWKINGLRSYWFTILFKPLRKVFQYRI